MAEEVKEVTLKVEEARQQDVNRGIARLDIEQAEKQTDSIQSVASAAAKKRLAVNEKNLQDAEKKEAVARKKYEAKAKTLDKQYKSLSLLDIYYFKKD